jgi:hypothetical protein
MKRDHRLARDIVNDDLDYARLKRSLQFFVDEYLPRNLVGGESHPVLRLEREEQHSMMMARRSLSASVADYVEATRGFSVEHVLAADAELEQRGAYTLSFIQYRFSQ